MTGRQELPSAFDPVEQWPMCAAELTDVRDQGDCSSCWALAPLLAAGSRRCIANATDRPSPMHALTCRRTCGGCHGGSITCALRVWRTRDACPTVQREYSADVVWCRCSRDNERSHYSSHGNIYQWAVCCDICSLQRLCDVLEEFNNRPLHCPLYVRFTASTFSRGPWCSIDWMGCEHELDCCEHMGFCPRMQWNIPSADGIEHRWCRECDLLPPIKCLKQRVL